MEWKPRRDWVGHWLSLVEARGELMAIRYGRLDAPPVAAVSGSGASAGVTWQFLPHARFDGLGGLVELFSGLGVTLSGGLPVARGLPPASPAGKLAAFVRRMRERRGALAAFRDHDGAWRPVPGDPERARPADGGVAFHLFSTAETTALVDGARRVGVTLNSLLLWALTRAVGPELVAGSGEAVWLVPVNMRGLVRQRRVSANHISFFDVRVDGALGPEAAHAAVRARLDRGAHWGGWVLSNLGEVIGERGVARVARAQDPPRASTLGAFSNLGALQGTPDGRAWLFCPPVSLTQPFGAGAVTWNGRLSLSIQLHPSLLRRPAEVSFLLARWTAATAAAEGPGPWTSGHPPRNMSP